MYQAYLKHLAIFTRNQVRTYDCRSSDIKFNTFLFRQKIKTRATKLKVCRGENTKREWNAPITTLHSSTISTRPLNGTTIILAIPLIPKTIIRRIIIARTIIRALTTPSNEGKSKFQNDTGTDDSITGSTICSKITMKIKSTKTTNLNCAADGVVRQTTASHPRPALRNLPAGELKNKVHFMALEELIWYLLTLFTLSMLFYNTNVT